MRSLILLVLTLSFLIFSCERAGGPYPWAGLEKVKLENLKGIPSEYGKLVAVTTHAQYEGWSQLWFVDQHDTIRMVRIEFEENLIHQQVLVIPRY